MSGRAPEEWRPSPGRPGPRGLVSVGKQEEGTEVHTGGPQETPSAQSFI